MNHRQWKKNFKKKHGRNPTVYEDKKLRNKYMTKELQLVLQDFSDALMNAMSQLAHGLAKAFKELSDRLEYASDFYRRK